MPVATLPSHAIDPSEFLGERLTFVIGAFRSGTTLLRKILDSHTRIYSPAETWFLLPLFDLWSGTGTAEGFDRRQAAAALQGHLDPLGFVQACRAFAAVLYRDRLPAGAELFVDKTPLYLPIAAQIAEVFPNARLLVLVRDPRGTLWSRATWKHSPSNDPAGFVDGVATDIRRLAAFVHGHRDRCHLVSYEDLCRRPEETVRSVVEYLDQPFEPAMLRYGAHQHHEGYGDEGTREHAAAHDESVSRWQGNLALTLQKRLLEACGVESLAILGFQPAD